jgi:hypothetical protein
MPFHPFWLIMGGGLVAVVLFVNALVQGARPSPPPAYGLRSPDGRWWWDGQRWQPVPPPEPPGS